MKATSMPKAQRSSSDKITILPQAIIETILCYLPIEDAARTSILSKQWRYKWTKIPKLVFFQYTVKEDMYWSTQKAMSLNKLARRYKDMSRKLFYAIHQVLLQRQGPIHEFTLSMNEADSSCFEIDQIILHLSRNHTLKKLKLNFDEPSFAWFYSLPVCVFSLNHLTDLHLENCEVDLKPIFNGFASLTSLTLKRISISREALLHLLSNCPSLKSLCLMLEEHAIGDANPNILELFKCLPVIENLTTWVYVNSLDADYVPEELHTSISPLKCLCVEKMSFDDEYGLNFVGVLTKCSPNLEKIKLEIETDDDYEELDSVEKYSRVLEKYSDAWLEHLNELEIVCFRCYELEVVLVKFILARSPNLKKVIIFIPWMSERDEKLEMLKTLSCAPRPPSASPTEYFFKTHSCFKDSDDED